METNIKPLTLSEMSETAKKRVALISKEFSDGFEFIKNYPRSVTFFGSARTREGDKYYDKARALARRIVTELHYSVTTGGGPGIMEAANRGAFEAGGNSLGLTIRLPQEQITNKYITDEISYHYFFSRKVGLAFSAEAYLFFPGGFGTLDEFLELMTLMQTLKVARAPMILVGESYWKPLEEFFKTSVLKEDMADVKDLSLYHITDDEDEILKIIKEAPIRMGVEYDAKADEVLKNEHIGLAAHPMSDLTEKHCIPCESGTQPLSHEQSGAYLKEIKNWMLIEDKEIEKTYEFKSFPEAMDFMNNVAMIAEQEGHHPEIKLHDFKKVDVRISTHSINGLSENDFILASKIDKLIPHPQPLS